MRFVTIISQQVVADHEAGDKGHDGPGQPPYYRFAHVVSPHRFHMGVWFHTGPLSKVTDKPFMFTLVTRQPAASQP